MFKDRAQAGRKLAAKLKHLKGEKSISVFALPRGGVPVGREVARALEAPLDIVVARKLGAPGDPELAIGAVVGGDNPQAVLNDKLLKMLGISEAYLLEEAKKQAQEIGRREAKYRGGLAPAPVKGRTVILVDDGIATGASARAAVRGLKRAGAERVILAVPVAPSEIARELSGEVDEFVCLEEPSPFVCVGRHYENFDQVSDEDVVRLLESSRRK